jgi:hypothetical protein
MVRLFYCFGTDADKNYDHIYLNRIEEIYEIFQYFDRRIHIRLKWKIFFSFFQFISYDWPLLLKLETLVKFQRV